MATQQQPVDDRPHPADVENHRGALAPVGQSALPVAAGETSSSAIAARARAEVEARFVYAMRNPRDFQTARRRILDACKRPRFAEKARYAKPIGGGKVFGLSVRFAEEVRVNWGNLDVTAMLVFDDAERQIYRVQGVDLETNATDGVDVIVEKFVERRQVRDGMEVIGQRVNTGGQIVYKVRATEDDFLVKANNRIAKARRNVILTLIPADIKEEAEAQIIETMRTADAQDPQAAIKKIIDAFWPLGVMPAQIVELLGHPIEQSTPAEIQLLRTYYQTLSEGEGTWAEIFEAHTNGKRPAEGGASAKAPEPKGTEGLKGKLGATRAGTAPALVKGVDCKECGAKVGQPHKDACPLAD